MTKKTLHYNYNSRSLHHQSAAYLYGREIVFGIQDGMVSALSAITGIAVGSHDHFIVLLSGLAIISAGAISMAIGTFTSLSSQKKMEQQMIQEERTEIFNNKWEEKKELEKRFIDDGWGRFLAETMALSAYNNEKLMLREMAYRELSIVPDKHPKVIKNSIAMFFAWLIGGLFPLSSYFFMPVEDGIIFSICITLTGLFLLGVATSLYTKEHWLRAGLKIFILAGLAIMVGYALGHLADVFIVH
jgi:VIT1/CCC1 family predicted Fe2+/Mn2+ transporter